MNGTPPKTDISGLVKNAADLMDAAFKKGVKHGRYLEWQSRPHARWDMICDSKDFGVCTNCRRSDYIHPDAKHCRFCGAKMDGGSENADD